MIANVWPRPAAARDHPKKFQGRKGKRERRREKRPLVAGGRQAGKGEGCARSAGNQRRSSRGLVIVQLCSTCVSFTEACTRGALGAGGAGGWKRRRHTYILRCIYVRIVRAHHTYVKPTPQSILFIRCVPGSAAVTFFCAALLQSLTKWWRALLYPSRAAARTRPCPHDMKPLPVALKKELFVYLTPRRQPFRGGNFCASHRCLRPSILPVRSLRVIFFPEAHREHMDVRTVATCVYIGTSMT